ncbi:hypothetical protein DPSP01_009906 [Paraphaeosphaeria sporulosa]
MAELLKRSTVPRTIPFPCVIPSDTELQKRTNKLWYLASRAAFTLANQTAFSQPLCLKPLPDSCCLTQSRNKRKQADSYPHVRELLRPTLITYTHANPTLFHCTTSTFTPHFCNNKHLEIMSSIIHSLSDLAKSLIEVVWSLFTTAGDLAQKTVEFVLRFFTGAINLFIEFFKGLVDLAGGIVQFVLGNIAMLAILGLAFFGFLQYQRSQGRSVQVGNKKLN